MNAYELLVLPRLFKWYVLRDISIRFDKNFRHGDGHFHILA